MDIDQALEKIYSLKQFHVKLGLDNINDLLNHIGNPQNKIKTFHVAGSNGKGSTCSFLASMLQENGFRVGLFTSPHLVKFNERIRINGKEIADSEIIKFLENNKSYIENKKPTFFEISTALAFEYFAKYKVDYAVIETGLGGRLDATNVLTPIASVITTISLEHSHILGNTIKEIAVEKAGIFKKNVPIFTGDLPEEANTIIESIAKSKNSKIYSFNDYIRVEKDSLFVKLNNGELKIERTGLLGFHQLKNAALSILTLNISIGLYNSKIIQLGLDNIVANSGIQGRFERFARGNIIFDAAHNLEGIQIFLNEFRKNHKETKNSLIFGAMADKDISQMLILLSPYFSKIYITSTNYQRAASAEDISQIAKDLEIDTEITNCPKNIIDDQINNKKSDCLVILGSIYLIGQIKRSLSHEN